MDDKPDGGRDKPDDGKDKPDDGKDKPDGGRDKPDDDKDKPDDGKDKPDNGDGKRGGENDADDSERRGNAELENIALQDDMDNKIQQEEVVIKPDDIVI